MTTKQYLATVNAKGRMVRGETWIGPEELTYPSGSLRNSARRGMVRYPDGKVRSVVLGVPDTYFTIPARGYAKGKTLSGHVTTQETTDSIGPEEFVFVCDWSARIGG